MEEMKALVRKKHFCVLATASEAGQPHCSLMAYVANPDCTEIYMATHSDTRKYGNLRLNPRVSLLVDSREENDRGRAQALTVEGIFEPLEEGRRKDVFRKLGEAHPSMAEFLADPKAVLIRIRIRSFLMLDGLRDARYAQIGG